MSAGRGDVPEVRAQTIRLLRRHIVLPVFLFFIVAFLDRVNIGFAALTMNAELSITNAQFGWLTGVFFIGYFLFEVPSNLLLHRIGARIWIARILLSWGIIAVLTGFVRSVPQLYVLRFALGVAEAGFFPGILLYLTYWFPRSEQARVVALFIAAAPISGVLGGPLSGFILDHVNWFGISSWRWLLILEGCPAILFGFLAHRFLPNRPVNTHFLNSEQTNWLTGELAREAHDTEDRRPVAPWRGLLSGRIWYLSAISFNFQIGAYAMYFWMPQAVRGLVKGYSNFAVGALVMIPYAAAVIAMILVSRSSDRRRERRYHAAASLSLAGIALLLLPNTLSPPMAMFLWACVAMGISSFNGPFWSMPGEVLSEGAAAVGIAVVTSVGGLGGFVGPYLIGAITTGGGSLLRGLATVSLPLFLSAILIAVFPKGNPASRIAG